MTDSQTSRNSIRKNIYCSELKLLQSLSCLERNMVLTEVAYFIVDTYYYFVIPMRELTYLFIYYLNVHVFYRYH